jgi:hypothetical protein
LTPTQPERKVEKHPVFVMQLCARCRAQMEFCGNGAPICRTCSVREILTQEVLETTVHKAEAFSKFEAIMLNVPSGLPQADGVQRIKNASNELSIARKEMARAYTRLSDFVERGIVPDDLKAKVKKASTA